MTHIYSWTFLGLTALGVLCVVAPKWVLTRLALLNSDLRGFLVFVLWNVLFGFGLASFEDHHYTAVRFYILIGSIGILSVVSWLGRVMWPEEWKALEFKTDA